MRTQEIGRRARELAERTADTRLAERATQVGEASLETRLMANYRDTSEHEAFSLLYELTHQNIHQLVSRWSRGANRAIDTDDIVQEVFLAIYRYPTGFRDTDHRAFAKWSYSIVRNTTLRHLRSTGASALTTEALCETVADPDRPSPLADLVDKEEHALGKRLWFLFVAAYQQSFLRLSERERLAIRMTYDEGRPDDEVSSALGVKPESLKMIVWRAHRKILHEIAA